MAASVVRSTRCSVSRLAARLFIPFVALLAVGCGDGEPQDESVGRFGRLVVEKSLAGLPIFTEGSTTRLRIVDADGEEIVDELRPVATHDVALFDRAVPEGAYRVTAVERPCQGNCTFLDPPVETTRCEIDVAVTADRTTRVAIVLSHASGEADSDCSAATARSPLVVSGGRRTGGG